MLAKESAAAFNNHDWLFEIKWDGYRAISEIKNGVVELYSRNGISFNTTYPIVYNQLKKIKHQVIFDGEIVVINDEGKSDFQKLQHYEDNTQFPLRYYVFDLLSLNGEDTTTLPLIKRKKLLKKIIQKNPVIKYSEHIVTNGVDFFNAAKDNNLEGIMAKKINSQYHKGARTSEWLKIKYHKTEEVVIAGFTKPAGSRDYFGALVLAVKSKEGLKYAGHTGSGFTNKMLKEVYEKLKPLITNNSAFKEIVKTNMPVTWVKPNYVCEIKFTEWTTDGKMRHPIFLRMREDKTIKDIVMVTKKNTVKTNGKLTGNNMENDGELVIGKTKIKFGGSQIGFAMWGA